MNITLKGLGIALEIKKVDTPTGGAWKIEMPDGREMLIKFHQGKWRTEGEVSKQLLQEIGNEISRFPDAGKPEKPYNSHPGLTHRPKRARIMKYVLI